MFKLAVVLLMVAVACNGFLTDSFFGSYLDRGDLLSDEKVQDLTNYAVETMFMESNSFLKNVEIVRVQTQIARGTNYKIDFTGEPVNGVSGQTTTCQVVIHVGFNSVKSILQSQCQTS